MILDFLKSKTKVSTSNQTMMASANHHRESQIMPRQATAVHFPAYFGLKEVVKLLLAKDGVDSVSKDDDNRTLL